MFSWFAIAVAVTSIPVISKIFLDLGLIKHRFARIVLVTATIQDLFLWIILSLATGLTLNSDITFFGLLGHVAVTVLMFVFAMFLAPALTRWPRLKQLAIFSYDSIYFVLCFLCICIGGLFGISIIYSAFVAGLMFRKIKNPEAVRAQAKIRDLSLAFFTPVYFAIVGLRIHLTGDFDFGMFLMILLIISVIELAGCLAAMRAIKMDWLSSLNLGVAMNARGGPGIVLATVTYELGIINYDFMRQSYKLLIINAEKIVLTGNKWDGRVYLRYTGYPGGQREFTPSDLMEKGADRLFRKVVKGMLPKNRLGAALLKNLHVYAGAEHLHEAQQPKTIDINALK